MSTTRNYKFKNCDTVCSICGNIHIINEKEFDRYKLFEGTYTYCYICNKETIHYVLKEKNMAIEKIKSLNYTNRRINKLTKSLNINN